MATCVTDCDCCGEITVVDTETSICSSCMSDTSNESPLVADMVREENARWINQCAIDDGSENP